MAYAARSIESTCTQQKRGGVCSWQLAHAALDACFPALAGPGHTLLAAGKLPSQPSAPAAAPLASRRHSTSRLKAAGRARNTTAARPCRRATKQPRQQKSCHQCSPLKWIDGRRPPQSPICVCETLWQWRQLPHSTTVKTSFVRSAVLTHSTQPTTNMRWHTHCEGQDELVGLLQHWVTCLPWVGGAAAGRSTGGGGGRPGSGRAQRSAGQAVPTGRGVGVSAG